MSTSERIHWAPRVSQAKIWRLYQTDALGIVDEELIDDVGWDLYVRCQSILMVSNADVECPHCGEVVHVGSEHEDDEVVACPTPGCAWGVTLRQYRASFHRQHLIGPNANSCLRAFVQGFRRARDPREKMVLIDQLIHTFHQQLKARDPLKSAAPNLIEGKGPRVVAFLDRLAYGDASTPGLAKTQAAWRERLERERAGD